MYCLGGKSSKCRLSAAVRARRRACLRRANALGEEGAIQRILCMRLMQAGAWCAITCGASNMRTPRDAMYYNPAAQTVLDYHNGIADVRARRLRMIGDPAARYREDPVRMLRVVR